MNTWYQNKIIIVAAVLVVLVAGWFLFFNNSSGINERDLNNDKATSALEKHEDGVRIVGQIECLPYRKSVDDEECVKGIKDAEGRYFALDSIAIKGAERTLPLGTPVVATGIFEPADTSSKESNVFSYEGVLVIKTLSRE
ncbi:MAG: hypothetical protein NUV78_01795 [Candidatus Zambryskibacteria bacterium]|nr:hypothetical protein [Candidatus Zambryskibacteria bacterium]